MTKGTPYMVFVADSTREALAEPQDDLDFVDELEVRGRARRLRVWGLARPESRARARYAELDPGAPVAGGPA